MACTSNARNAYCSCAVTNTTAGSDARSSRRSTLKPSSSGIWTSKNTRSGAAAAMAAAASRPLAHTPASTTSRSRAGRLGEPRAVVPHREMQGPVDAPRADQHAADRGPRRDAVLDRVLDERLENEVRHRRIERLRIGVEHHLQPVAKADLLDVQVA